VLPLNRRSHFASMIVSQEGVDALVLAPLCATLFAVSVARQFAPPPSRTVRVRSGMPPAHGGGALTPDVVCKACKGARKVACITCMGEGRLNYPGIAILPKGEFPQW
jgi:hypothetical protein